jgi:hypothetical protein
VDVVRAGAGPVSAPTGAAVTGAAVTGAVPGAAAPLWRRLFDDAAIFPPGDAPLEEAVPAYAERAGTALGSYVGPFIAPAGRWAQLCAALPAGDPAGAPLELSATSGADPQALAALLDAVAVAPRVALRSVEVAPVSTGPEFAGILTALGDLLPAGVTGYLEVPLGPGFADAAAAVRAAGYRIKIRTGGTVATAFPSAGDLAAALVACVRLALPFKLTAGLHNALRHRDGRTGFEHHGFLNVLAAVAVALEPAGSGPAAPQPVSGQPVSGPTAPQPDPRALAAILDDTDPARVAGLVAGVPADRARRVRELFTSFGTCSIDEPLGDLVALGLIKQETGR